MSSKQPKPGCQHGNPPAAFRTAVLSVTASTGSGRVPRESDEG